MNHAATGQAGSALATALDLELPAAVDFLSGLLRIPSLSGHEDAAMHYLEQEFASHVDEIARHQFPADFEQDPEFSTTLSGVAYRGRFGLECRIHAVDPQAPWVVCNSHVDVVPPTPGQVDPFTPRLENGSLHARGACDAKGQLATLYLLARLYRRLNIRPGVNLVFHLVPEEESGGNGSLNAVRHFKQSAIAAIVLEPTRCRVLSAVRGAVWFRLTCRGTAGHSGNPGGTVNAIRLAIEALGLFDNYHRDLLAKSRNIPLFSEFPNPMPLNFGHFTAGNWPATAPEIAIVEGVLGFLTNRTRAEVMQALHEVLREHGSVELRERASLEFMYRHEAHALDSTHPLLGCMLESARRHGNAQSPGAFPASCDGWFYSCLAGIPTIVFGPGQLSHAHAIDEQIQVSELAQAAGILFDCLQMLPHQSA